MQKQLFFLILLLCLVPVAKAITNPYLMTHDKFVHLNQEDKQKLIIKTMEMMVELEGKFAKEVKVTGQNSERSKTYARLLKQLRNFLLSEAVAADFVKAGAEFTSLLSTHKGDACIYGGWVSKVHRNKTTGAVFCLPPAESGDKKIVDAYQGSKSCKSPENITCNPMVFGYKKAADKSLFCVDNGLSPDKKKNKAHNVSYECMSAALNEKTDKKTQDSKEDRLKAMSVAMASDPAAFNSVHHYIFQTCACGKADEMDKTYKSYIRPHRTCFGMMNTLKALNANECSNFVTLASSHKENEDFIKKWNTFFDQKISPLPVPSGKLPQSKVESDYKLLIEDPILIKYCDGEIKVDEKKCILTVSDVSDNKTKSKASITVTGVDIKDVEIKWPSGATTIPNKSSEALYDKKDVGQKLELTLSLLSDKSKTFTCFADIPALDPIKVEKKCHITVADSAGDKENSLATIAFTGMKESEVEFKWPQGGIATQDKAVEATFEKKSEIQKFDITVKVKTEPNNPIKCSAEIPAKSTPVTEKKCTISVADSAEDKLKAVAIIAFTGIKENEVKFSWPQSGAPIKDKPLEAVFEKKTTAQKLDLSVDVLADAKNPLKCFAEIPALSAPVAEQSCSIVVADLAEDPTKSLASLSFSGVKDEEVDFAWPEGGTSTTEKPKEAIYTKATTAKNLELSATLKADSTKKIVCPAEIPAKETSDDPKSIFKIEAKAETYKGEDTSISVKAIIKNDKGEEVSLPAGHKVSWTRSGAGVSKIKEVKKEKNDSGTVSDDIDNKQEEVKPLTDGEFATGVSISAPRVESDYKVTAHLIDDKGADVAQDDEAIPLLKAKEIPKPNNNQNNGGGYPRQAPVFQLTPFNTSTQGIQ